MDYSPWKCAKSPDFKPKWLDYCQSKYGEKMILSQNAWTIARGNAQKHLLLGQHAWTIAHGNTENTWF